MITIEIIVAIVKMEMTFGIKGENLYEMNHPNKCHNYAVAIHLHLSSSYHKGLGLPQVLKKVLKKELKKNYRTQKSTQKRRCTFLSTQKSTHKINKKNSVKKSTQRSSSK